jgi:hypothetical protein
MISLPVDQVREYIVLLERYFASRKDLLFEIILHQVDHKHEQHFLLKSFIKQRRKDLFHHLRNAETFSRNLNPPPCVQIFPTAPG